jgi:hypothetical protein
VGLVISPAGVLTIAQKIVPLEIQIEKFGTQHPADANRFAIQQISTGEAGESEVLAMVLVKDEFAPDQFFELSDTDRLTRKSFEQYTAGVSLEDSRELETDYAASRVVEYEFFYIDEQRDLTSWRLLRPLDPVYFDAWAVGGAVAASALSYDRNRLPDSAVGKAGLSREAFGVVYIRDLTLVTDAGGALASEAEAYGAMQTILRSNPALDGEIQVVPAFEVKRI